MERAIIPKGRFAPSPSGRIHLGNILCCLMAWLSARQSGGRIVLRVGFGYSPLSPAVRPSNGGGSPLAGP